MRDVDEELRGTIETLCGWERGSASAGERRAAEWIAAALREQGCEVQLDAEQGYAGFAPQCSALDAAGVAAGVLNALDVLAAPDAPDSPK